MTGARRVVAALVLAAACSGGDSDDEGEGLAMTGREMVGVYELLPPEEDPMAVIARYADVFGIDGTVYERDLDVFADDGIDDNTGTRAGDEPRAGVGVNLQTYEWRFSTVNEQETDYCDDDSCDPVTITEDEALARTKQLWADLGVPDDLVHEVETVTFRDRDIDRDGIKDIRVRSYLRVDGRITSLRWTTIWADGDELFNATGQIDEPVLLGEAPLLTPEEALGIQSQAMQVDLGGIAAQAELTWEATFSRETLKSFLLPIYRIPIDGTNPELGLTSTVSAIRAQDFP